jgi:hypothetical protein
LDMRFRHNLGARVELTAFSENATDGIKWIVLSLTQQVDEINYRAVQVTPYEIDITAGCRFVLGQSGTGLFDRSSKFIITSAYDVQRARVGQIQTIAEINDSADDEWIFDLLVGFGRMFREELRPFLCAFSAVFPELRTVAEPVVNILA